MDKPIARTLTVSVASIEESFARAMEAAERIDAGEGYQGEYRTFGTLPQLFELFTPRRWALISKLKQVGPSSLRGLARELGRDVKRVHEDVAALLEERIIERNERGQLTIPFKTISISVKMDDETRAA
jgi:predicted transcriptional regulator